MSKKSEEDEDLKKALQRIHQNIEIPDSSKSWSVIQHRLNKRKRLKKRLYILKVSCIIVISSLMLNLFVMTSLPEVHSQVSGLFKKVTDNFIEIFLHEPKEFSIEKAKTSPPSDESVGDSGNIGPMLEVTLEEAQTKATFKLLVPTYIPKQFELDTIRLFGSAGKFNNIHIKYTNANGELISISEQQIEGETTDIKATMAIGSGHYKDVTINGNNAILIVADKGNPILEWFTEDYVQIRISGKLTETQILEIATSLE